MFVAFKAPAFTPMFVAIALALGGTAQAVEPAKHDNAVIAQLELLTEQFAAQQAEIERLRNQVDQLELAQRGRGISGTPVGQPAQAAAYQAFGVAQVVTTQTAQGQALSAEPQEVAASGDPAVTPTDTAPGQNPTAQNPATTVAPGDTPVQVGEARRDEDAERREKERALVVNEYAPLFERRFTFDAGFTYSYYDRRQLALSGFLALDAIFLGTINLDQTKASVMTFDISGRYGLTDRLSVEANLPYLFRDTRFVSGGAGGASNVVSEVQLRSKGIGDASVAAYYQLVKESQRWPDVVTSLRVRGPSGRDPFGLKLIQPDDDNNNLNVPDDLPTGTGIWSATANVSALRTYDPVILFGNLGYTYNQPGNFDDISPVIGQVVPARVSLGNSINLSGGLAIALNDRSAVSFSVASTFSAATHTSSPGQPKARVAGSSSNSTALNIGASYALPSGWTLNGQLAAGLTPDAPNFVFALRASHPF